ncbi:hypothetical protein GGU10DRAFT_238426, partial [Lentinula aff. detonsa]
TDNLIPAARIGFKIPAEIWYKKWMDIAHLRPFGVMGWGTIVNKTPGKLDLRVFKGRLVGYGPDRGVYLLYTSSGRVVPSRDVEFEERILPTLPPAGEEGRYDGEDVFFPTDNNAKAGDAEKADEVIDDTPAEIEAKPIQIAELNSNSEIKTQPQPKIRRSTRTRNPSSKASATREFLSREDDAKNRKEAWATSGRPRANVISFAMLTTHLPDEVNSEFNIALTVFGLPIVPKSYRQSMEDPERWMPAIKKEKLRMEEFGVFG